MNELRIYALLIVIAGVLRTLSSFIQYESGNDALELFFVVIDLCFILGLLGFYLLYRNLLTLIGRLGFVLTLCGFALIAGPEANLFGMGIYQMGSSMIGLGVLLLSVGIMQSKIITYIAPAALIASVLVGGVSMVLQSEMLFVVSGILFGSGFVVIGLSMWGATNKH
jgi:hypothetical protein